VSITEQDYQQFIAAQQRIHDAARDAAIRYAQALRDRGQEREARRIERIARQADRIRIEETEITLTAIISGEEADFALPTQAILDPASAEQLVEEELGACARQRARQAAQVEQSERAQLAALTAKYGTEARS